MNTKAYFDCLVKEAKARMEEEKEAVAAAEAAEAEGAEGSLPTQDVGEAASGGSASSSQANGGAQELGGADALVRKAREHVANAGQKLARNAGQLAQGAAHHANAAAQHAAERMKKAKPPRHYWVYRLLYSPSLQDERARNFQFWAGSYYYYAGVVVALFLWSMISTTVTFLEMQQVICQGDQRAVCRDSWWMHRFHLRPGTIEEAPPVKMVVKDLVSPVLAGGTSAIATATEAVADELADGFAPSLAEEELAAQVKAQVSSALLAARKNTVARQENETNGSAGDIRGDKLHPLEDFGALLVETIQKNPDIQNLLQELSGPGVVTATGEVGAAGSTRSSPGEGELDLGDHSPEELRSEYNRAASGRRRPKTSSRRGSGTSGTSPSKPTFLSVQSATSQEIPEV